LNSLLLRRNIAAKLKPQMTSSGNIAISGNRLAH